MKLFPDRPPSSREIRREHRYIKIKRSRIPGAGKGVFARRDIPADTFLGIYRGERLTPTQYETRYPKKQAVYIMKLGRYYVDARDEGKSNWTRFVNASDNPDHPLQANCMFFTGGHLRSIKDIPKGTELLVPYGNEYRWDLLPKKQAKKAVKVNDDFDEFIQYKEDSTNAR